jgi:uncharacterized protein (DUF1810 family)
MEHSTDSFDLDRFVQAQDKVFERVIDELRAGKKKTHWMWYIFPQLRGLGTSAISEKYGISGAAEAEAYLAHGLLGPRLAHVTALVLEHRFEPLITILAFPDNLKFHSSMTLFSAVAGHESVYARALYTFCNGTDPKTMSMLGRTQPISG